MLKFANGFLVDLFVPHIYSSHNIEKKTSISKLAKAVLESILW